MAYFPWEDGAGSVGQCLARGQEMTISRQTLGTTHSVTDDDTIGIGINSLQRDSNTVCCLAQVELLNQTRLFDVVQAGFYPKNPLQDRGHSIGHSAQGQTQGQSQEGPAQAGGGHDPRPPGRAPLGLSLRPDRRPQIQAVGHLLLSDLLQDLCDLLLFHLFTSCSFLSGDEWGNERRSSYLSVPILTPLPTGGVAASATAFAPRAAAI